MKKAKQLNFASSSKNDPPSPTQIAEFLEDFRQLAYGKTAATKLISLRVPENLLRAFRAEAERSGFKYQSLIVRLMHDWTLRRRSGSPE